MENKIEIRRTVEDLQVGSKLHSKKHQLRTLYICWMLIIGGIAIILSEAKGYDPSTKLLVGFIFIALGGMPLFSRWNAGHKMAKKYPNILVDEIVFITEEELQSQTENVFSNIKWVTFTDAAISEEAILLYINPTQYILYPKRFFSEEQYSFLKEKSNQIIERTKAKKKSAPL
jgi:hypothetical protein